MSRSVVAIIEARMGSSRLPGKNAMPILGEPMLGRLVNRLRHSRRLTDICVATTTNVEDDRLEAIAREFRARVFRGSQYDVLERVFCAGRAANADIIVEITGDCPLMDPRLVDAMVDRFLADRVDYMANVIDEFTFPDGLDLQVYPLDILAVAHERASDPYDRENVTPFIYRHPELFSLINLRAPAHLHRPEYRLTVDYPEDLDLIRTLYEMLERDGVAFGLDEVIVALDSDPALPALNAHRRIPSAPIVTGGAARQELLRL